MAREFVDADPRTLRLPSSRPGGPDPINFQRQLSRFGRSTAGMPPIEAYRDANGLLMIWNGVTRAARVAKLSPGTMVRVEVLRTFPRLDFRPLPTVAERLP